MKIQLLIEIYYCYFYICNVTYIPFLSFLALNPAEVWAEGPGLEAEGLLVKKAANFTVHTENAGSAKLEVKCVGPSKP